MAAARPEPTTPRKNRPDSVDKIICNLNLEYNLAIELPDKSLTPSHRRQRARFDAGFDLCDKIYRGIHFLYYQNETALSNVLHSFHYESKAACQKWVPKPRADPDSLPSSTDACRASSPGERLELQTLLLGLIDRLKASLQQPRLTMAPVVEDQPDGYTSVSPPSKSKRPAREKPDGSIKRVKGGQQQQQEEEEEEAQQLFDAIDEVPVRQKVGISRLPDPRPNSGALTARSTLMRNLDTSLYRASENTSKVSMFPSIFSEDGTPPDTQSTVEATREEKKRLAVYASSQDPFRPTSSILRALAESVSCSEETRVDGRALDQNASRVTAHVGKQHITGLPGPSTTSPSVSDVPDMPMSDDGTPSPQTNHTVSVGGLASLEDRLKSVWPAFPPWLHKAPLAVAWEVTRIALHCSVDLGGLNMQYDPSWADPGSPMNVRKSLYQHLDFAGKSFPEKPSTDAWAASLGDFRSRDMVVVLSMSIDFNQAKTGPPFFIQMQPLKLDLGCRLNRHFGPDRFLEVIMPSPGSRKPPFKGESTIELIRWITGKRHSIVGREWAAFFTSDAGYRSPPKELRISPDAKPVYQERVHFFAENGIGFVPRSPGSGAGGRLTPMTALSVCRMLDWLLNLFQNEKQSYLKLFSRIKLGLSKTRPILVLEPHQIRHRERDLLSPIRKEMNDGIALMSLSVARKVRDALGLNDIPSAIQARLGSAKGMWLVDVTDDGHEDWLETYPSQRKWECDQRDDDQRTLEVHGTATELRSAGLNLQFLPVLEDRARNKPLMREVIGKILVKGLQDELETQKSAMKRPLELKSWLAQNTSTRQLRLQHGQVPFLAGLPEKMEDTIGFLLDGGFHPMEQRFLQDQVWKIQEQKCHLLKTKLNIAVGRSAYIYMVVDFWGVLEEGEVHVGFSTKFQQGGFSGTLLHDMDVLVARSPAHFISDIQKVRAVFKPELQSLKDVIVFSSKGNIPLAEKLSGGDYDGDRAWVCWDPDIVDNFVNAEVPASPDLSSYIRKDTTTLGDLLLNHRSKRKAIGEMIERSFEFNMRQSFLGICTNFKERLCYHKNRVDDEAAVILSTLLSSLVDQPKQGILFGEEEWDRLRKDGLGQRYSLPEPAYKGELAPRRGEHVHIIDHLKFVVAKPTIEHELAALHRAMNPGPADSRTSADSMNSGANYWDPDLVEYCNYFEEGTRSSKSRKYLLDGLKASIAEVLATWVETIAKDKDKGTGAQIRYPQKVNTVFQKWCAIEPSFAGRSRPQLDSRTVNLLKGPDAADPELSAWALIKASTAFKIYHSSKPAFVWRMAGRQLQFMKAVVSVRRATGAAPVPVTPLMYAGLAVDKKFVKQYIASLECGSSDYVGEDEEASGEDDDT